MGLITVEKFIYPSEIPGIVRFNTAKDPILASDHFALAKLILAIQKTIGLVPAGRFSTLEARVMNAVRINSQVVSAANTGAAPSWTAGVNVVFTTGLGGGGVVGPLFTAAPIVLVNVRQAVLSGDGNTPFKFWTVPTIPPSLTDITIKGRAKGGGGLGAGTTSVSVVAVGFSDPAE